jgi:hypothetical protein
VNRFNTEHYCDPTAAEALANVVRDEKKKLWKPCVFICSPFAGNIDLNTLNAKQYLKFAVNKGAIPFAPHLLYPLVLDDGNPVQRELGLFFGLVWLGKCDELWVFGRNVTPGMGTEIIRAKKRQIPVRYFTENCEEVEAI